MHLAGYARVSIEKNVDDLQGQLAGIRRWGRANGFEVEIVQEVESAAKGSSRPVFDELLERVENGEFDGLVVQRLDRFGRSLSDILYTIDRLQKASKHFYAFDSHLHLSPDNQDPMTRMFFHILATFAEFERDLLKQRLAMGRDIARANGKHLGRPPRELPIWDIHRLWKMGASIKFLARAHHISPQWMGIHLRRFEMQEYPYGPKEIPGA